MDEDQKELYLKGETMHIKTDVEIKEETECFESFYKALFGHESVSLEWQSCQIKDESLEDVSVKEESIDFNTNEIRIQGYSKQKLIVSSESDFCKNNSLAIDEKPESTSAFSSNNAGDLFHIKNEQNDKVTQHYIFKCSFCLYQTEVKQNFKIHLRIHTGEKPFQCGDCSYSGATSSYLKKHKRIHTGERPFQCEDCSFTTAKKYNLEIHKRIHIWEKPFKCAHCSYSTSRNSDLQKHLRIHTGEKPFKCGECSYSGATSSQLKRHHRIHTTSELRDKPFKCRDCSYSATENSDLKKHLRIHTGGVRKSRRGRAIVVPRRYDD